MATSYTFVTSTVANTAVISSTKVKVVANNACYYSINGLASATSNVGPMIPANLPKDVNMQGLNNFLSIVPTNNTITSITVTVIGGVAPSGIA
ncbi:MAG TPA: hypothetical protein VFM18_17440 [Methanosarcina sp.]|nr:hypothetical protein [Methanosarcina sp.]